MRILYLTNYPSPYKVDFFNELGKHSELTVLFENKPSEREGRKLTWFKTNFDNFQGIYLTPTLCRHGTNLISLSVKKYLVQDYDAIIVGMYSTGSAIFAIKFMQFHRISYYISTDGGIAKTRKGLREAFKKSLISKAYGFFSPSKASDEYLMSYGACKEKIHRYSFTSLMKADILPNIISASEKSRLRIELGMPNKPIILGVGQFIHRKGWDILIKGASSLQNYEIYIIGGIVTPEYETMVRLAKVSNIHFVDFMSKEKLAKYYKASDIFVLPTREDIWGLVINEAMAYGLPVISTNRCIAAIELIKDGENGFIIPVEDSLTMVARISEILSSPEKLVAFKKNALSTIGHHSIEEVAMQHICTLKNVP